MNIKLCYDLLFFCLLILKFFIDINIMDIHISSTLSVSQKEPLDCHDMALKLSKAGIVTSITSNISTQPGIEYGCRLTQSISSTREISDIWTELKKNYHFKCAHLKIDSGFDGCILNYLAMNQCGGKCEGKYGGKL